MTMRQMLRSMGAGAAISLALLSAPTMAADCKLGVMADLPVTMEGLRASVPIKVNGTDTSFWLDSGAFFSIMSKAKATELQLPIQAAPFGFYLVGIGGHSSAEIATIRSFGIVGQSLSNIKFLVGGTDAGNGLIGRNILAIADTEFDLAHGSVKLIKPHGCDKAAMAYWAGDKPYFTVPLLPDSRPNDRLFRLPVTINGVKIEAVLDTGAPASLLSRRAAERAGIDFAKDAVVETKNGVGGFGRRMRKGWVVPVASFGIGDEEILRTRMEVVDDPIFSINGAADMLLGADYMLAHHIYVAREQRRIYFTYSGGKPFLTRDTANEPASTTTAIDPTAVPAGKHRVEAVTNDAAEPKTAEEFARRGNARLTARNMAGGVADLTEAIRLAPGTAAYYSARARAYGMSGEGALGRADLDKALSLDPADGDSLRIRAGLRLSQQDRAGALADTEAAAKVTPPSSLDALEIAELYQRLDLAARAIPVYSAVIATHREDARLGRMLNGRCWVRAIANVELDEAMEDCNRALKRDGIKAQFLDSRGFVYFRKGDFAAAIADYDAALRLQPKLVWSLQMRGLSKIAAGQAEAGKADLAAARAINPQVAERARRYGLTGGE